MIDSFVSTWHGTSTLDDFKVNGQKLSEEWGSRRTLREFVYRGMKNSTSIKKPHPQIAEFLKQVKQEHPELTLKRTHNETFEDLLFTEDHQVLVAYQAEVLAGGIFKIINHQKRLVQRTEPLWECHVFKIMSHALTRHTDEMRALFETGSWTPSSIVRKELYKSWATIILLEKTSGTITFKGYKLEHQDECTPFVDPFLQSLPLELSQRTNLRTLFDQDKMYEFVQKVIEMVTQNKKLLKLN